MDDTVLNGKPDVQAVNDALGIIRSDEKIGQIMLYMRKTPECALSDGRWGSFDEQEPLFKRCILGCAFYRITFLRDILQKIVDTLTPEQDKEWSGAYNFELFGGLYSKGWKVLSSMVRFWPIHTINLIAQGKVAIGAWNSVKQTGVPDEILKRGMYSHDDNPYMQKWASASKK